MVLTLIFSFIDCPLALGHLDKFGDVETVHIVDMRVYPSSLLEVRIESLFNKFGETLLANINLDRSHLDKPLLQSIVYHLFVLKRRNRTS